MYYVQCYYTVQLRGARVLGGRVATRCVKVVAPCCNS